MIIISYDKIGILKELLFPLGILLTEEQIMICLNSFSYKDTNEIITGLRNFSYGIDNNSFVYKFYNLVKKSDILSKAKLINKDKHSTSEILQKLFSYMPYVDKNVSLKDKKNIVAKLFGEYSYEVRNNVIGYIFKELSIDSCEYNQAAQIVKEIGHKYVQYIDGGLEIKDEKAQDGLNKVSSERRKRKSIYDRVLDVEGIDKEQKKKFIDEIISTFTEEEQAIIRDYTSGILDGKEYQHKCGGLVRKIRIKLIKKAKILKVPQVSESEIIENIFNKMPLIERVSLTERKQVFLDLFNELAEYEKNILKMSYLGMEVNASQVYEIIKKLAQDYSKKFVIGSKKTLAQRMPLVEGISRELQVKITTNIFGLLPSYKKEIVNEYLKSGKDYIRALNIIQELKQKYKKYIEFRMRVSQILENKFLCDKRLSFRLSIEQQRVLNKFFKGNLEIDTSEYILAFQIIKNLEAFLETQQYIKGRFDIRINDKDKHYAIGRLKKLLPLRTIDIRCINSDSLSLEKINIIIDYLELLETCYCKNGASKEEYYRYANQIMMDIYTSGDILDLEMLYFTYIGILREELNLNFKLSLEV